MNDSPGSTDEGNSAAQDALHVRSEERFDYTASAVFISDQGREYFGHTVDVSLNGAFLRMTTPPQEVSPGDGGVIYVHVQDSHREYSVSFPCLVARVIGSGLGLTFDDA